MDDDDLRNIAGLKVAMDNVLTWSIHLGADNDPDAVSLEIDAWLAANEPHGPHTRAVGGCILLGAFIRKLARMHGMSEKSLIRAIVVDFPGQTLEDADIQMSIRAVIQIAGAVARFDFPMARDLMMGHARAGGSDALIDVGATAVQLIGSLLMSYPEVLFPSPSEGFHGRN